jgi:hypothetical protein
MGLGKIQTVQDEFTMRAMKRVTVPADFVPDFYNRNINQVWDEFSGFCRSVKWKGVTLVRQKLA